MRLAGIRLGIAEVLRANIAGVTVLDQWPDALAFGVSTVLVVLPTDTYVEYSRGSGLAGSNKIGLRVVCLPLPSMGPEAVQAELDDLLSCGAGAPRSIRSALATDLSALGSACSVEAISAGIRVYQVGTGDVTGAEVLLAVSARCS